MSILRLWSIPTPQLGNQYMCTVAKLRQKSIKGYTECKRAHVWLRELYGAVFVVPPFTELHFCIFLIRLLLLFIAGGSCWKMRNWEKKRREWGGNGRTLKNKDVQNKIKYILQIKLIYENDFFPIKLMHRTSQHILQDSKMRGESILGKASMNEFSLLEISIFVIPPPPSQGWNVPFKRGEGKGSGISRDLLKKKGVERDLGRIFYSPFSSEVYSMGKGAFSINRLEERILMLKNPEKKHYQVSFTVM